MDKKARFDSEGTSVAGVMGFWFHSKPFCLAVMNEESTLPRYCAT